jgi:hypothetical protein
MTNSISENFEVFGLRLSRIAENADFCFDLGIMILSGGTAVYVEGSLLEGTFYVFSQYMLWSNWPSSGVTG